MTLHTLTPELRATFRILYWDIFWIGILVGTTLSFQGVYATRLGASSFQLGLLSAGPAVVALLYTLPAGLWVEGRPLIRVAFLSALWMRLGYLLLFSLPWFLGSRTQIWGLILLTLVVTIPATLLNISFNAMFAEIVPAAWRGEVVAKRTAVMAVSTTLCTLLSGQILDRVKAFPLNYQIVFLIGGIGAMVSTYTVGKLFSANELAPIRQGWRSILWRSFSLRGIVELVTSPRPEGKALVRLDVLRGSFGGFLLAFVIFYAFQFLPNPLYPLIYVRELGLPDSAISLGTALFNAMMMIASLTFVSRLSRRIGHRWMLISSTILSSSYTLLMALARDATLFWVASLTGGVIWAVMNVGIVNRLMDRVPDDDRPAHMALYNLAVNQGVLVGSLLGPAVGDWLGLRPALWVTTVLQILAGLLFWWLG